MTAPTPLAMQQMPQQMWHQKPQQVSLQMRQQLRLQMRKQMRQQMLLQMRRQMRQRMRQRMRQQMWQQVPQETPQQTPHQMWQQVLQQMAQLTQQRVKQMALQTLQTAMQMAQQTLQQTVQEQMTLRFVERIALSLSHVPLEPPPAPVPNGVPLDSHVPMPQKPQAQHPVVATVLHTYNCVPRVPAVPLIQPNDSASGPMYYPRTTGDCCGAPEYVPGGIMVPSGGFVNIETPQQSAARNPSVLQQYDPSRANPYSVNGGHVDSRRHSPEYNVNPFGFQRNDAQSTGPKYYHDATNNNVESTPHNAAHLEAEDDLLEREIETLGVRIDSLLKIPDGY